MLGQGLVGKRLELGDVKRAGLVGLAALQGRLDLVAKLLQFVLISTKGLDSFVHRLQTIAVAGAVGKELLEMLNFC